MVDVQPVAAPVRPAIPAPRPLRSPDGRSAREDWTLAPGVRHLNHGSFGGVPAAAQAVQAELRREMERNPSAWFTTLVPRVARARHEIAEFLGSPPGRTALVPNASAGMSVVFDSIPLRRGMRVLVTDHAYGAVAMGAGRLAARAGGRLDVARIPLAASDDEAFSIVADAMGAHTALVVIDQVTSATARALPAARIAEEGRRRGIPVAVDAAHAPGIVERPLAGIDADFWVGNLHKFACAPRGTAALVARPQLSDRLFPLIDSWAAEEPFPARFDQQGTVDATAYLAAPVAFSTIEARYGWEAVRRYARDLGDYGQSVVATALGNAFGQDLAVAAGAPLSGLRLVRLPTGFGETPEAAGRLRGQIARATDAEVAVTSWRGQGFLRLSTHAYTTAADLEEFADRVVPFLLEQAASS